MCKNSWALMVQRGVVTKMSWSIKNNPSSLKKPVTAPTPHWHKAKENNDFASFCPILQELVDYNRKFAVYYDAEKAPYDALLNEYERGVDSKQLYEKGMAIHL